MASIVAGGVTTSYLINGLGQRIGKVGTGVATGGMMFVYDEAGHMLGDYDSSGNVIEETVWLPDTPYGALTTSMKGAADIMGGATTSNASPVAVMTGTLASPVIYAISPDWLNAPYRIADASGTNVWWWDHYPFGDNPPSSIFGIYVKKAPIYKLVPPDGFEPPTY